MILNQDRLGRIVHAPQFQIAVTIFFFASLAFLAAHAAYDGIVMEEAEDWGVTLFEYFFYLALVYLIVPPVGLILARRSKPLGWGILALYAFQVMYGAGITDDRPMLGIMPRLLDYFGIHVTTIQGYGFFSIILEILGLAGDVEPKSPSLFSTVVADANIVLNAALLLLALAALTVWWMERRAHPIAPRKDLGGDQAAP